MKSLRETQRRQLIYRYVKLKCEMLKTKRGRNGLWRGEMRRRAALAAVAAVGMLWRLIKSEISYPSGNARLPMASSMAVTMEAAI